MSVSGALRTPSKSKPRGSVCAEAGVVGEVDRRRGDGRAEPVAERAAALGVREAVEREAAEELEQRADGGGLEHDRVLARAELGERLVADLRGGLPGERVARRSRAAAPAVAAAKPLRPPASRQMTFMNASVTSSSRRSPVLEAIAVRTAPAVQMPNASRPCSAATANAAASAAPAWAGSSRAVAASKPAAAGAAPRRPSGARARRACGPAGSGRPG